MLSAGEEALRGGVPVPTLSGVKPRNGNGYGPAGGPFFRPPEAMRLLRKKGDLIGGLLGMLTTECFSCVLGDMLNIDSGIP